MRAGTRLPAGSITSFGKDRAMRNYSFNKPHRPAKAHSLRGDGGAGRHISRSAAGTSRNGPRQNAYTFFHVFVRGNGLPAVSPLLFALIILTFFLPFVTVSCGQYELETVRLVDFQRAELVEEGEFGGRTVALLLVILAPLGLLLGLWKGGHGRPWAALVAAAGLVLLIALQAVINRSLAAQNAAMELDGVINATFRSGFYLSFFLYLAALGVNLYLLRYRTPPRIPPLRRRRKPLLFFYRKA